ncbi:MAG: hypothetical protein ABIW94_11300 [Gemmatimonadaceae bacterium]
MAACHAASSSNVDDETFDDQITFADGRPMTIRDVLWDELLHHLIRHRGQLTLMCRMSSGAPPGLYGPNREEMNELMERMQPAKT